MELILKIIFPTFFLVLKFLFKFAIGRNPGWAEFFEDLSGFPVDISFLSLSFAFAFTLLTLSSPLIGIGCCLSFILIAFLLVFLWRKIQGLKDAKKSSWIAALFAGLFVSMLCLVVSIKCIYGQAHITDYLNSKTAVDLPKIDNSDSVNCQAIKAHK